MTPRTSFDHGGESLAGRIIVDEEAGIEGDKGNPGSGASGGTWTDQRRGGSATSVIQTFRLSSSPAEGGLGAGAEEQ